MRRRCPVVSSSRRGEGRCDAERPPGAAARSSLRSALTTGASEPAGGRGSVGVGGQPSATQPLPLLEPLPSSPGGEGTNSINNNERRPRQCNSIVNNNNNNNNNNVRSKNIANFKVKQCQQSQTTWSTTAKSTTSRSTISQHTTMSAMSRHCLQQIDSGDGGGI